MLMIEAHSDEQKFLTSTLLDRIGLANDLFESNSHSWDKVKEMIGQYLGHRGVSTALRVIVLARDFNPEVAEHVGKWTFVIQSLVLNNQYLVGKEKEKLSNGWAISAFERLKDTNAASTSKISAEVLIFCRPLSVIFPILFPPRRWASLPMGDRPACASRNSAISSKVNFPNKIESMYVHQLLVLIFQHEVR